MILRDYKYVQRVITRSKRERVKSKLKIRRKVIKERKAKSE